MDVQLGHNSMEEEIKARPASPMQQKLNKFFNEIESLKEENPFLLDHVKPITKDSLMGSDWLDTFQDLYKDHVELKKKYLEEARARMRLYNEVIELKGNIRVFCRCRPLSQSEIANGCTNVVEFDSSHGNELQIVSSDSSKKQFKLDHVFKPEDSQEVVFAETLPLVASVLDGYNVCIFAYGQTGTGKTFTMEGVPENRGVNYRTLERLFLISQERSDVKYEFFVSMLEVYNDKINDLLAQNACQPNKRLEIKQAAEGTLEIPGIAEVGVRGTEDVWDLLKSGSRVRSVGSTNANELSSRSHCLVRVTVKGESVFDGQRTRSHLWLVDLAGSERVGKTEAEGERLKESQFINKSLSALGDVISALASKSSHIPYRNSKLTHMLQSSLGGDCKTLMFVQISPSNADVGETLCSLNFASRVRGIESGPARKQTDITELLKSKHMFDKINQLEKEKKKLQDSLESIQLRYTIKDHSFRGLQDKVRELEAQLGEERKLRLKQEARGFGSSNQSLLPPRRRLVEKNTIERRPPMPPSKLRQPARRISNFSAQTSANAACKTTAALSSGKENHHGNTVFAPPAKNIIKPRRVSLAVRQPPPTAPGAGLPRRRVSIATFHSESAGSRTPVHGGSMIKNDNTMDQQSFVRAKTRYSRPSLLQEFRAKQDAVSGGGGSRFMGSPVAIPRKSCIWSPMKMRALRNSLKPSFMPA